MDNEHGFNNKNTEIAAFHSLFAGNFVLSSLGKSLFLQEFSSMGLENYSNGQVVVIITWWCWAF
jgi:hypothetical protein